MSEKQLQNCRLAFNIPTSATVLGLIDSTIFKTGEAGFVITDFGIHWTNPPNSNIQSRKTMLLWDEVGMGTLTRGGMMSQDIAFGEGSRYSNASTPFSTKTLFSMLLDLQNAAREFKERRDSGPIPDVYVDFGDDAGAGLWTVGMNSQTFGPYDIPTIHSLIESGQIDQGTALAWKDGMGEWVPLSSVPDLVVKQKAGPPPLPPPLPPSMPSAAAPSRPSVQPQASTPTMPTASPVATSSSNNTLLDVNSCPVDILLTLPGMTTARAAAVDKYRREKSGVRSLSEFGRICGLKPHEAERLRGRVSFVTAGEREPAGPSTAGRRVVDY